jgi:hypothetical protein
MTVSIYDSCESTSATLQQTWKTEHPEDKSSHNSCLAIASIN